MRVVLDTNVLISALLSRQGIPGQLLQLILSGRHTLVLSRFQIEELFDVAGREHLRARIPHQEMEQLTRSIEVAHIVLDDFPVVRLSPDPKDDPILGAAIAGNADLIVSGDKRDMLVLKTVSGIPVMTPREALDGMAEN